MAKTYGNRWKHVTVHGSDRVVSVARLRRTLV
jgi:hypothetical protein